MTQQPPPQQPPPFNPDVELIENLEGNKREVRKYRQDAEKQKEQSDGTNRDTNR